MNSLNKLKILIVGLTTVLSLAGFSKSDFRKGLVHKNSEFVISDYTLFRN